MIRHILAFLLEYGLWLLSGLYIMRGKMEVKKVDKFEKLAEMLNAELIMDTTLDESF